MADGFLQESVIGKAIDKGLIEFKAHDLPRHEKANRNVGNRDHAGAPMEDGKDSCSKSIPA